MGEILFHHHYLHLTQVRAHFSVSKVQYEFLRFVINFHYLHLTQVRAHFSVSKVQYEFLRFVINFHYSKLEQIQTYFSVFFFVVVLEKRKMVEENFQVQVRIRIQIRSIRSQMVLYFLFFPIFIKFLVNFRNIFTSKVTKLTILIDKGYFMTSSEIFMLPFVGSNIVWTIDIAQAILARKIILGPEIGILGKKVEIVFHRRRNYFT